MSLLKGHYHPFLFLLIALVAIAEMGLVSFLFSADDRSRVHTERYHSLLILFLFNSVWTTLFSSAYILWILDGSVHVLASVASSVIWLLVSTILWVVAAAVMRDTRSGGTCECEPAISRCRQSLTVEALGWTEFSLCLLTLILTCWWVTKSKRGYVSENDNLYETHTFLMAERTAV